MELVCTAPVLLPSVAIPIVHPIGTAVVDGNVIAK
jgi:hypothetical protein